MQPASPSHTKSTEQPNLASGGGFFEKKGQRGKVNISMRRGKEKEGERKGGGKKRRRWAEKRNTARKSNTVEQRFEGEGREGAERGGGGGGGKGNRIFFITNGTSLFVTT